MSTQEQTSGVSHYEPSVKSLLSSTKKDPDFIKQCFWNLKAEYDAYGKKIALWSVLGVAFICLFELLNRRLVGQVSFSGIEIRRLSFLLYIMPPLVALSGLNLATFNVEENIYIGVLKEFALQEFPELRKSEILDLFLAQQGTFGAFISDSFSKPLIARSLKVNRTAQILIIPVSFLGFEIYAYIQLFTHSAPAVFPTVISLCFSALTIILAIPLVITIRVGKPL